MAKLQENFSNSKNLQDHILSTTKLLCSLHLPHPHHNLKTGLSFPSSDSLTKLPFSIIINGIESSLRQLQSNSSDEDVIIDAS